MSQALVAVTCGLGASLFMSGFAHAEPMLSAAKTLSETGVTQSLGLTDEHALFGALTFGFSILAAGVWHRSFRAVMDRK